MFFCHGFFLVVCGVCLFFSVMRDRRYREVKSKASKKEELESFFYWQVLVFVLSEKLIAPIEVFVFFIEADSKVAAGSAERMEEIIVFDAVVRGVVFVVHVFKVVDNV